MKWPFVSRAKYEAALEESLFYQNGWDETAKRYNELLDEREKRAAARRAQRAAKKAAPVATVAPVEPPESDIPPEVIEAIEARAGSLGSRVGQQMMRQATKALKAGEHPDRVAAWMLRGDE